MRFQDLKMRDVRMISFNQDRIAITVVLAGDRIETFEFRDRDEAEAAIRAWAAIPDAEKPDLPPIRNCG